MSKKRICVIGAGNWGKNHIRTLNELGALAGIVETNKKRGAKIQVDYPDIEFFNSVHSIVECGFDGSVSKPMSVNHLLKTIRHFLE